MPLLPLVAAFLVAVAPPATAAPSAAAQAFARGESVDAAAPGRAPELDLARMDHFLNTYGGVRYAALDPKADDGWLMRKTRTAGRAIFGTVALGAALGYEGVKAVDQKTGWSLGMKIPRAFGQQGYDFNTHSSKASWGGVGAKVSGAFYGVFDEEPNAPARR